MNLNEKIERTTFNKNQKGMRKRYTGKKSEQRNASKYYYCYYCYYY